MPKALPAIDGSKHFRVDSQGDRGETGSWVGWHLKGPAQLPFPCFGSALRLNCCSSLTCPISSSLAWPDGMTEGQKHIDVAPGSLRRQRMQQPGTSPRLRPSSLARRRPDDAIDMNAEPVCGSKGSIFIGNCLVRQSIQLYEETLRCWKRTLTCVVVWDYCDDWALPMC